MGKRRRGRKSKGLNPREDPYSIGNLLLQAGYCSAEDIENALEFKLEHPDILMGQYLVTEGIISEEILDLMITKQLAAKGQNSGVLKFAKLAVQRTRDIQVSLEALAIVDEFE